jgi:hypothetical protein
MHPWLSAMANLLEVRDLHMRFPRRGHAREAHG